MTRLIQGASLAVLLTALCGCPAFAQAGTSQPAPATDMSSKSGTLSDKLDTTNGVIHPQDSVDPDMEKEAPAAGTMPVIPPAGSPGGATDAQPK